MNSERWTLSDELETLAADACCGQLAEDSLARFETLLRHPRACRWYRDLCLLQAELRILTTADRADAAARECVRREAQALALPVVEIQACDRQLPTPMVFHQVAQNAAGFLSHGWPLAYLIAVMVLGVGLLVGSFMPVSVSQPVWVARESSPPHNSAVAPGTTFVGRITGMADCQWADESTLAFNGAHVPLGRRYALASGLMEVTYDSGAKVILQGPCTYEIESAVGGYLSVGKLTAKVDKKEERRTKNEERPGSNSSFLIPHSYFAVRTPTATVTDLGTEFGVEVGKDGGTTSHVFRGSVAMQTATSDGKPYGNAMILRADESARVIQNGDKHVVAVGPVAISSRFIREIPRLKTKNFDLVDVAAGGDGFSGKRNAGIDPTNGRQCDQPPRTDNHILYGNPGYHRVEGMPFVDGVFVPDGRDGPAQIDSAGHVLVGYTRSSSPAYQTSGYVWAGGGIAIPPCIQTEDYSPYVKSLRYLPVVLNGVDYSSSGHGVLCIHPNKGITFDLDAVRLANPGWTIVRFRAVAANVDVAPELTGLADIRVMVDGQQRFQRRESPRNNSAFSVDVPISGTDRFLTLVSTDGDDGLFWDWVVFGDPRLELRSTSMSPIDDVE